MVANRSLFAMADGGVYWIDTGTPETYLAAQLDLIEGRRAVPPGITLTAIDPTANIASTAIVRSSTLGPDVEVGDDAEITESIVHRGAKIGAKARVHRSIVGAGASIGERTTLDGLSVVGEGETVGPGLSLQGARVPSNDT
jgi:mannose-1-phosphate guanylyltransferase